MKEELYAKSAGLTTVMYCTLVGPEIVKLNNTSLVELVIMLMICCVIINKLMTRFVNLLIYTVEIIVTEQQI